jgi:AraC family transcriptional regulator, positive regulator of tynA and feaB
VEELVQTLYNYSGTDAAHFLRTYGEVVQREYYDGELQLDDTKSFNITVQKALAHPISLIRLKNYSNSSFRRSWDHIRRNNSGVRVLFFVQQGSLKITRSGGTCEVKAGECAILDAGAPFYSRAIAEGGGAFHSFNAIVPAHIFLSHLPSAAEFHSSVGIDKGDRRVITSLVELLFNEGSRLCRSAAESLVAGLLDTISHNINDLIDASAPRRIIDRRLDDIEAYITKHLADPDLSFNEVAAKCGISQRYLCYVLKANNTSFSELLWGQRLLNAREWLGSEAMQNHPIFQIACMAGFKSAAHFSRMFKATYGCSPKEYRLKAGLEGTSKNISDPPLK